MIYKTLNFIGHLTMILPWITFLKVPYIHICSAHSPQGIITHFIQSRGCTYTISLFTLWSQWYLEDYIKRVCNKLQDLYAYSWTSWLIVRWVQLHPRFLRLILLIQCREFAPIVLKVESSFIIATLDVIWKLRFLLFW